jgi:hypothetical protein
MTCVRCQHTECKKAGYFGKRRIQRWRMGRSGNVRFVPSSTAYRVLQGKGQIREVRIDDVGPVSRDPMFRDSIEEGSARDRVVRLLRGFRSGDAIPPVEVVKGSGYGHPHKLTHGAHRFYCSLAAGFTHVPTVEGFDSKRTLAAHAG